jgi:O-antigen ligase
MLQKVISQFKSMLHNGIALCVMAMPLCALLYDPNVIFPFITLKAFAFHSLSLLSLILCSILFFIDEKFRINLWLLFSNKLFQSNLIYFSFIIISGIFSENYFVSLWGTSERADGIFLQLFCFYLTVAACTVLNTNQWKMVFISLISVSVILFIFQILQFSRSYYRPGSLLNQPTFLASFYVISIGSCLLLNSTMNHSRFNLLYKSITYSLIIVFILGIIISGTRASFLAITLALAAIYFFYKKISLKQALLVGAISLLLILGGLLIAFNLFNLDFNKSITRIFNIQGNLTTLHSRLINVLISLNAINPIEVGFKNFLIGWGWGNYYLAWDYSYMPMINHFDPAPFDKAHNTYLDILVSTGLIGFLAFNFLIYKIFQSILSLKHLMLKLSLLFIFTSKFIELFFTFDSVTGLMIGQIIFSYLIFIDLFNKEDI